MHPLQRRLYKDHYHFQRLLYCLQREINFYEVRGPRPAKLSIILDALDYIQVYPEKWHHPVEDVIFRCLLEKDISERELIQSIIDEHKDLEKLTHRVNQLFCSVANDCVVPVAELTDAGREFILQQSAHLDRENEFIYPLINQYLTHEDWDRISEAIKSMSDPLFDTPLKADYENLYQHVIEAEEDGVASAGGA